MALLRLVCSVQVCGFALNYVIWMLFKLASLYCHGNTQTFTHTHTLERLVRNVLQLFFFVLFYSDFIASLCLYFVHRLLCRLSFAIQNKHDKYFCFLIG